MLFDHDAKVGGDSARFADLLARTGSLHAAKEAVLGCRPGIRNLRAEMTALSTLAAAASSEISLVPAGARGCRIFGALAGAAADGMSGHAAGRGDNADLMPFSSGSAGLALRQRLPCVPDFATASCVRSPMTIRSELAWSADLLARHLDGQPDRRADMGLRDLRAGGPLPAVHRRTQPDGGRPTASECTYFPGVVTRGVGQVAALTADRASVSLLTPTGVQGSCMRANPAPGSNSLPRMRARRSAAIPGTAKCPAARPPPPSCPMRPGVLAYHRRDNVPGQIRAQIGPLDHPPRSPRGQGPCDRNPPCNLTR
jgi:hypothetical protein